jgi:cell division protease FtsH
VTSGASNDLQKATEIAKQMIMRYGMSDKLGPRTFGHNHAQPFLGREFSQEPDYSDEIAQEIDAEIKHIVEDAHATARQILLDHREELDTITNILVERETLEKKEFEQLLDGVPEEEVFREKDEERAREAGGVKKPVKEGKKKQRGASDEAISGEPPLEAPSYTRVLDQGGSDSGA